MTSKLNCWMAPILICLSSVSSSICISDVDRCLQADIQAVCATLPCRERERQGKGGKWRKVTEDERIQKRRERWKGVGKIRMGMRKTENEVGYLGKHHLTFRERLSETRHTQAKWTVDCQQDKSVLNHDQTKMGVAAANMLRDLSVSARAAQDWRLARQHSLQTVYLLCTMYPN